MDSRQTLDTITSDACVALFGDYSLPLRRTTDIDELKSTQLTYCAVIGFNCEMMRGTLLLATTSEPVGRTSPVNGGPLREWIAELSNQLLGRIKRQLVERGVILAISTPIVLRGEHLRPLSSHETTPIMFESDAGGVCVWMDTELSPDLDLTQKQTDCQVMGEGEALLF